MIRITLPSCAVLLCAVLAAADSASAADMVRKAGEWEVTMKNDVMGSMTHKICFGTDKSISDIGNYKNRMKACSSPNIAASGGSITVDTACTGPSGGNVGIHAVITQNGSDAYHSETHMHMEGAPQGTPGDMTVVSDAKRLGPCQPGEQPVD